jgi:hypothetical protein
MGMLMTAVALVAALVQPHATSPARHLAAASTVPQTLYASSGTIQAFAQDGADLAWFSSSTKTCNAVWVVSLDSILRARLPDETSTARNVTCRWDVAPPVSLALAGSDVLWTLRESHATLPFDYVLGAGLGKDTSERRFQEVAHAKGGPGLWLGGIAGDSVKTDPQTTVSALVYGTAVVQYVDELGCLSGGSCKLQLAPGAGGVYRVVGRPPATLIHGTRPAVAVAVSGSTLAYVPAAGLNDRGRPVAAADQPIEIVDANNGNSIAHVSPGGTPVAIALTGTMLVTLERTPNGLKLAWYSAANGTSIGSVPVPSGTALELSANDQVAVFRTGRFLHALTFATSHSRTVAQTVGRPIGVSIEGNRLAWAENIKGRGRIRALYISAK